MFSLNGKVAFVTGSARGLGASIAKCLGQAGADVVVNYTSAGSKELAEGVATDIREMGRRALVLQGNVSKEDDVKSMINTIQAEFGRLDILCNNAGINSNFDIDTMTLEEWQRIQDTNITGGFLCSKYALPLMKEHQFGRIIMISSVVGQQGALFGQIHYAATKGAQISFAKTLARTVAKDGITVNCVAPGVHMTETLEEILVKSDASRLQGAMDRTLFGTLGSCDDIGYAVTFLATEEARYITGATLDVNGGLYLR